ncbi:MAG: tRNA pseudouridine(55) synthase TruB [Clostridiales bacterium]|nr:tRNA pseudouridine(55) synthase TruB [Clostridiales bacterium]
MDGILNILKPPGMTSFDVVSWLRGVLRTTKIGHTGTLDPMASGVLPVCVGKATRAIEFMMDKDKVYRAELALGSATDTQDSTGRIISGAEVTASDDEIKTAVMSFKGRYLQLPPMYSAIKVDGKKLYELARKGTEVERQPRELEIYSIEVLDIERTGGAAFCEEAVGTEPQGAQVKVLIDVHCSKGTYIRTLCDDIGARLGCGGHMSFLLRKRAGAFTLDKALTLEEIADRAAEGKLEGILEAADMVFDNLEQVTLNEAELKKLLNGVRFPIRPEAVSGDGGSLIRAYSEDGVFIALGELTPCKEGFSIKSRKLFL